MSKKADKSAKVESAPKKGEKKKAENPKEVKATEKKEVAKEPKPKAPKVSAEDQKEMDEIIGLLTTKHDMAVADLTNKTLAELRELKEQHSKPAKKVKEAPSKKDDFASFCGATYDPSAKSDCEVMCVKDFPEEHKKCKDNFATRKEEAPKNEKVVKSKRKKYGVDFLGWGSGTSASMINLMLLDGFTVNEMSEQVGCPTSRVRGHLGNLMNNFKHLGIVKNEKNQYKITSEEVLKSAVIGKW